MSEKAYLLVFSGQGDIIGKLINEDAWEWLNGRRPQIPDNMILDYITEFKEFDSDLNHEKAKAEIEAAKDDRFNDKALFVAPSRFNHRAYHDYSHTTQGLIRFLNKHALSLENEWHGYDL
jgi:hypothetical protein